MNTAEFCNHFYNFTFIPIYCYADGDLVLSVSADPDHIKLPDRIFELLIKEDGSGDIYETEVSSYYGRLRGQNPAERLVIGPVKADVYSREEINKFFHIYHVKNEDREAFERQFAISSKYQLIEFYHMLSMMQQAFNGENVIDTFKTVDKNTDLADFKAKKPDQYDDDIRINIIEASARFAPFIREGNVQGLIEEANRGQQFHLGEFCLDKRDNHIVIMIISLALAMKSAVEGGMSEKEAYLIIKYYIEQAFKAKTAAKVDELSMTASLSLVNHMREFRDQRIRHTSLYNCIQYIRDHIYTPITVKEVAEYSGYTEEYFSRLFKKEMGFGPLEFIYNCKLLEARSLLQSTNKSVGEISEILYFSNQSHFQRRFKEKYGMTPKQFRNSIQP